MSESTAEPVIIQFLNARELAAYIRNECKVYGGLEFMFHAARELERLDKQVAAMKKQRTEARIEIESLKSQVRRLEK